MKLYLTSSFLLPHVPSNCLWFHQLAGIGLIGVGIAVLLQLSDVLELIPVAVDVVPISIIVLGSIIFLISFLGCCGALRESCCMLSLVSLRSWILALLYQVACSDYLFVKYTNTVLSC